MKNTLTKTIAGIVLAGSLLASCVSPGGDGGILFNYYSGPFQATDNQGTGKIGESSIHCILGLVCVGDAGIGTASQEAAITKVSNVDYKYLSILGILYNSTTIVVMGE